MATTVTSTERIGTREREQKIILPPGGRSGNGGGGNGSRGPGGGGDNWRDPRSKDERARLAIWVALASIVMLFVALTSAYIVLSSSENWRPINMPGLLWLSTLLIIASSFTFHTARNHLKQGDGEKYQRWILLTATLGLAFIGTQLLAWRQLAAQGVYLESNPHSAFFFVLTGAHGLHLLGGVLALAYLLLRTWNKVGKAEALARRQAAANAVGLYWHFMDGLWIYLFLLLFLWR